MHDWIKNSRCLLSLSWIFSLTLNCFLITCQSKGATASSSIPQVKGVLEQTTLTGVDPKTGKTLWKATAKSIDAQNSDTGKTGQMHSGIVTLYHNGIPEAVLTAPLVTGDTASKEVKATGGVLVKTLTGRDRSTMRCNSVIWHSDTDIMLGQGNVIISGNGFVQTGSSFQADTKMQSIVMPAPGYSGGVHTSFDAGKSGTIKRHHATQKHR
jgi:lipopolysaccharide assembly outer membrane protein LptD (OstA)